MFEKEAEEHICNGKCQDDISRNYIHCKTCTRLDDFLDGLKAALDIEDASDKKLEPILYKLKDLGIIKSWYYNGTYHAH